MIEYPNIIEKFFSPTKSERYRYWLVGNTNNLPLVLLCGYANIGYEDFEEITQSLQDKYFLIIPEYPGWGKSSRLKSSQTIKNYAKYLNSLLSHLNLKNVVLLGHCFGAIVATEFAYQYPLSVSKLILVNPPYLNGMAIKNFYLILARTAVLFPKSIRPLFYFWRSRVINVPIGFFAIRNQSLGIRLHRMKNHIFYQFLHDEESVEENWISFIEYKFKKAKKIRHPVHVIHGEKDLLISLKQSKKFYRLFSNATFDEIKNAGHIPFVEEPEILLKTVSKYLYAK